MDQITQSLGPTTATALAVFVGYVTLCRSLRYLRRNQQHAQTPYKTREDFKNMTSEDAFQIVKYVQSLEFPFITGKALAFALFKSVELLRQLDTANSVAKDLWNTLNLKVVV